MATTAPNVENTIVGKVGNVYVTAHGTPPPFPLPPEHEGFDITSAQLPEVWTAGNLGYLSEADTPTFGFALTTKEISAWQLNGNTLRVLQTAKVRTVKFTVREVNRTTWGLIEPGSRYTDGTNGSSIVTVPNADINPDRAGLFEIQDLDYGVTVWIYVPRMNIKTIGDMKFDPTDTANSQLEFDFLPDRGLPSDDLYYIASNHPGLASPPPVLDIGVEDADITAYPRPRSYQRSGHGGGRERFAGRSTPE